jgi:hypothetical protein
MARLVHVILEIATPHKGGGGRRYFAAIDDLRLSRFASCAVLGVVTEQVANDPTHVPDFGHDCKCKCENPEPYGVDRYFGVSIVLDGNPTVETLAAYWLRSGISRVELCGLTIPETELKDREPVAEAIPA